MTSCLIRPSFMSDASCEMSIVRGFCGACRTTSVCPIFFSAPLIAYASICTASGWYEPTSTKLAPGLVLVGSYQPLAVQMLAYAINGALKNIGQTLVVRQAPQNPRTIDISQLASDMNDGRIKQLVILGGDPVYNAN